MTVKLKSLLNGLVIKFGETEKEKQMFFPLDYTVLLSWALKRNKRSRDTPTLPSLKKRMTPKGIINFRNVQRNFKKLFYLEFVTMEATEKSC